MYHKSTCVAGNIHVGTQQGEEHVTKEFESIAAKLSGMWT